MGGLNMWLGHAKIEDAMPPSFDGQTTGLFRSVHVRVVLSPAGYRVTEPPSCELS